MKLLEKTFYVAGYIMIGIGIGVGLMSGHSRAVKEKDRERLRRQKADFQKETARLKEKNRAARKHEAQAVAAVPLLKAVGDKLRHAKK